MENGVLTSEDVGLDYLQATHWMSHNNLAIWPEIKWQRDDRYGKVLLNIAFERLSGALR